MAATVRRVEPGVPVPQDDAQATPDKGRREDIRRELREAERLIDGGDLDAGWEIVDRILTDDDPSHPLALALGSKVWFKQRKHAVAYQFAARLAEVDPTNPYAWSNLGMEAEQIYRFDEADRCFHRASGLAKTDHAKATLYNQWACMLVNAGRWDEAEPMARRALKHNPDSAKAKGNLGLACLAQENWAEGWPLYNAIVGFDQSRRKHQYKGEPVWDGSPGKRLVVYGEQGLGDEISFASMVPDVIKMSRSVVIDCSPKLQGLFARSFPGAKVYGTRWDLGLGWPIEDMELDASISIGALGQFVRNSDASFPGAPYLTPDPDRVAMWKALFAKESKPVIGIGWSGGVPWTASRFRRWTLEQLLPVFRAFDAVWVSLEYKDAGKEISSFRAKHPEVDLRQYTFGTLTQDYDDTAAMVAALDRVISMQTTVIHLAGALGKRCDVFVNKCGQWRYGTKNGPMRWYPSVSVHRQRPDGTWPFEELLNHGNVSHLHRV